MSVPTSEHKVYMYIDYYNTVCTEVYRHQRIETGGNLFGLWTTSGSAVIHVVLGPGQGCRRTTTSFHQDIEYMKRVGRFVNEGYMLCHIGEWHSHHSLSLNKPSSGDEQTVRRNFPQGMSKFLVIIANIVEQGTRIVLSPYFFTHGGMRYEKAEFKVLETNSPFSSDVRIVEQIELGAEGKGDPRNESNPRNTGSSQNGSTSPTYLQAQGQGLTKVNPSGSDSRTDSNASGDHVEPMDTSGDDLIYPPRDYNTGSVSPSTSSSQPVASPSGQTATNQNAISLHSSKEYERSSSTPANTTSSAPSLSSQNAPDQNTGQKPSNDYKRSSSTPDHVNATSTSHPVASPSSQAAPDHKENDEDDIEPSKPEIILKKIHDELKKWFGNKPEAKFEFKSSKQASGGGAVIEIKFEHNDRFWMVRFPGDFPAAPAKLFFSYTKYSLHNGEFSKHEIVKTLTNHVNILLSIKKRCSSYCNVCKNISKESLTESATAPTSANVRREDIIKGLTIELQFSLATPNTFADEVQSDGSNKITFQHHMHWWFITLPAQFPDKPAEVCLQDCHCGSNQLRSVKLYSNTRSHKAQPLNSATLIISAITSKCRCVGHCSKQK